MNSRTAAQPFLLHRPGLRKIFAECEDVKITQVFRPSVFYTAKCTGIGRDGPVDVNVVLTKYPSPDFVRDGDKPRKNIMLLIYCDSDVDLIHYALILERNYLVGPDHVVLTEEMFQHKDCREVDDEARDPQLTIVLDNIKLVEDNEM
jgi:hypothetical protein